MILFFLSHTSFLGGTHIQGWQPYIMDKTDVVVATNGHDVQTEASTFSSCDGQEKIKIGDVSNDDTDDNDSKSTPLFYVATLHLVYD